MKRKVGVRETLLRVREEASAARAFFHTWNALNLARGDSRLLAAINDYRHVDFFLVSLSGNFRLFFLSLGRIFDKRRGAVSLRLLEKRLAQNDCSEMADLIGRVYTDHRDAIERIRKIRNKSIAHMEPASMEAVLKNATITPNQVDALIDAVCNVLNKVLEELGYPDRISGGERNQRAVQSLLESLQPNRLGASDDT